ncbi:MAG TPA: sigma-70 family RNA polymerase sigma factor [Phycisphaerae bacterium]|nr:sigma-70 family RNA polymerase sigma factor [Phycisphaerae bacterium]
MAELVQDLVSRARRRDDQAADAFAALIERYERSALAVAYALLGDSDRAGDAVQDAFLRAWQELPRLQEESRFGGWLLQIVRNAAIDQRRRKKVMVTEFPDVASDDPDPAMATVERERESQVQAALEKLDETTRMAVTLRYYEGMSAKEIGELLEMSPPAVDMRLSRARAMLREKLADLAEPMSSGSRAEGVK